MIKRKSHNTWGTPIWICEDEIVLFFGVHLKGDLLALGDPNLHHKNVV